MIHKLCVCSKIMGLFGSHLIHDKDNLCNTHQIATFIIMLPKLDYLPLIDYLNQQ